MCEITKNGITTLDTIEILFLGNYCHGIQPRNINSAETAVTSKNRKCHVLAINTTEEVVELPPFQKKSSPPNTIRFKV